MDRGLAHGLALGAGALAAHELARRRDVVTATPTHSEGEAAAREGMTLPCGVARIGDEVGATFAAEWSVQARSLGAEFGTILGDLPALTPECALAWLEGWLATWWQLRSSEPIRFAAFGNVAQDATVVDRTEVPATSGAFFLWGDAVRWTRIGRAWAAVVKDRNALVWFARGSKDPTAHGKPYLHARQVAENLRELAAALDAAARAEIDPAFGEYVANGARALGRGAGNAVAWTIEEVLAPIVGSVGAATVGALVSTGGPYILLGVGVWWIVRRQA